MKRPPAVLILPLLLIYGSVHASELTSADEKTLIHEANGALSQQEHSMSISQYAKFAEQGNAGPPQVMKKAAALGSAYAQNELALFPSQATANQHQPQQTLAASSDDEANTPPSEVHGLQINAAVSSTTPSNGENKDGNKSEKTISASFGFDNTSGNYGTKHESTSTSIPAIISYGTDNYVAALTFPYLEQTGPAGSIAGVHRYIAVGSNKIISQKGLGDVQGSATGYLIDDENTGISLDLKAEVKFGTADVSKGLGTGKNDYSLEAALYKDFDKIGMSGTLGYTELGSPGKVTVNGIQENIVFHNVFYASAGSTYQISEATKTGLTLYTEQSSENGMPRQEEITVDFTHKINKTNKLGIYVLKGLANGSPDRGFGASLKSSF